MYDPQQDPALFALTALIAPAALAGTVLLAARKLRAKPEIGLFGALAFALAYPLGHRASLAEWPAWNPASANEALLWTGVIAAAGAALAARLPRAAAFGALAVAAAFATWLTLRRLFEHESTAQVASIVLVASCLAAQVAHSFDALADRALGVTAPLLLWLTTSAAALLIALSGSIICAQFAGSLAAILGAAITVAFLRRDTSFARGLCAAVVLQLVSLCVSAVYLGEFSRYAALLVIAAPSAALCVPNSMAPRKKVLLRCGAVLVPLALAVAITLANQPEPSGY